MQVIVIVRVSITKLMLLQIHVDRYKLQMFTRLSDPILKSLLTDDPTVTRFHACERFARCEVAGVHRSDVVYINPVVMSKSDWSSYLDEQKQLIEGGVRPPSLVR